MTHITVGFQEGIFGGDFKGNQLGINQGWI